MCMYVCLHVCVCKLVSRYRYISLYDIHIDQENIYSFKNQCPLSFIYYHGHRWTLHIEKKKEKQKQKQKQKQVGTAHLKREFKRKVLTNNV